MENIFYVYIYLDPRKPGTFTYGDFSFSYEPFYVGQGHRERIYDHLTPWYLANDGNRAKTNKIKKIIKLGFDLKKDYILKIKTDLSNPSESMQLEISLIKQIGRKDLKKGPLLNMTDGGEGTAGMPKSEAWKTLMRDLNTGSNNPAFGKVYDEASRKAISLKSPTKKTLKFLSPNGDIVETTSGLRNFCKTYDLHISCISRLLNKTGATNCNQHKGWTLYKEPIEQR